jgi:PTS system nitrogen regulatory IIA component
MKLKISEISRSLDLPERTLERWIRQGRIPVYREGEYCNFRKTTLEKWAQAHNLSFSPDPQSESEQKNPGTECLLQAMKDGGVLHGIEAADAESALQSAVSRMTWFSDAARKELL